MNVLDTIECNTTPNLLYFLVARSTGQLQDAYYDDQKSQDS